MTKRREIESSAVAAVMPVIALLPVWALAITVFWLPFRWWAHTPWWMVAGAHLGLGILLFSRPFQRLVLMRVLRARRPHPSEAATLERAWRQVAQANEIAPGRFLVAVVDSDELNAFACGGHLVIATSFAVASLPPDELAGVLAHELAHHLGSHTVAATVGLWLSLPVMVLARAGFFLQNVAVAATDSFARNSPGFTALGHLVAGLLRTAAWVLMAGLLANNWLANRFGKAAEYQADRRAITMGFGRELARALSRMVGAGTGPGHPSARLRIARIDAIMRSTSGRRH